MWLIFMCAVEAERKKRGSRVEGGCREGKVAGRERAVQEKEVSQGKRAGRQSMESRGGGSKLAGIRQSKRREQTASRGGRRCKQTLAREPSTVGAVAAEEAGSSSMCAVRSVALKPNNESAGNSHATWPTWATGSSTAATVEATVEAAATVEGQQQLLLSTVLASCLGHVKAGPAAACLCLCHCLPLPAN